MESMGLSFDSNKSVSKGRFNKAGSTSHHAEPLPDKKAVRKELEYKASLPENVKLRLSEPDTQYVIYMMENYGEDYKAMARDKKNYYQDTPKQIRKKILKFQKIPELFDAYKLMKEQEMNVIDAS
ncbi:nucleolar protein 16-like isoform X2 [Watersipora subatra]